MSVNVTAPYQQLEPEVILTAVESLGLVCSGSLLALNSYENRVYQVGIENASPVIVKFYRPHRWSDAAIIEEHQFAVELVEHEIPVVAPLIHDGKTLHEAQGFRFAIFPRWGGHALEVDNLSQLEWMGRFIGRIHAVGACRSFTHRTRLSIQTLGIDAYQFLMQQQFIPDYLQHNYTSLVTTVLDLIEHKFNLAGNPSYIRLHGDMHAGNVLWGDSGPHIVDLDDCIMGPAIQDIWMLLAGDKAQIQLQLEAILRGYEQFHVFNRQELHLIEALRTLRMLHYSAWLAKRWHDPAFPAAFPWFNTPQYWQQQLQNIAEQISLLEQAEGY